MNKAVLLVLILMLLGSCTDRRPLPQGEPYVIHNDGGGQLISAEVDRALLQAWGGRVEISGYCNSACVVFTTLPNACLKPGAVIGFHGANMNAGPVGNPQITRYLRAGVLSKWVADWQFIPNNRIHHITARRYAELDPNSRICGL